MGIYIPGMEMPDVGYRTVEIAFDADGYPMALADGGDVFDVIPVPSHGRLIDADELWEKEKSECALKKHCPKGQSIIFDAGFLAGYRAACQIASKMPTIIPADGGENE